jgi:hypothetical protein
MSRLKYYADVEHRRYVEPSSFSPSRRTITYSRRNCWIPNKMLLSLSITKSAAFVIKGYELNERFAKESKGYISATFCDDVIRIIIESRDKAVRSVDFQRVAMYRRLGAHIFV